MSSHYVGMMSGTSLDAVDALLIDFSLSQPKLIKRCSVDLPIKLKELLTFLAHSQNLTFRQLAEAEDGLTRLYADCALQLLANLPNNLQPKAMGCHGQTLEHQPNLAPSYTLQLLNPSLLAELTGQNIIADFRRRDLAAGGQAAPLVPAFHRNVFQSLAKDRIIVNLGGIANVTYLPKSLEQDVIGFDTGPANLLLDYWHQLHWKQPFDEGGQNASGGKLLTRLLEAALEDEFFSLPAPKSTGREKFNPNWLTKLLSGFSKEQLNAQDVLRTLTELTAASLTDQIQLLDPDSEAEIFICGGGWKNSFLIERIRKLSPAQKIASTEVLGIPPQDVEAAAFAWLAWRHVQNKSGNLPSVTGALGERVLGGFYPA
ncbi:anhydro-N-acetylmuramic acid kinase [Marinospirillum insulare]|uniref:Anhydro-N-acetylmuramic acid kinase n=1 Tax=Marinospirillum insulare TaxID=217169 RepID=A0ABQ5ZX75_9GAMM|nr:anhydro-N-acetylmuramic acid kinase [Marinospirillum insulare]GLR64076.1 anhydro-N-acetylmuramic acid kinase [Marinospirillum insulare]